MKTRPDCPHCSSFRTLNEHLFELSLACEYLGNVVEVVDKDCENNDNDKEEVCKQVISTQKIADWLKLASRLEEVKIDSWRFESDISTFWCSPAADQVDSDSEHYTNYSTVLTRFLFVMAALEEMYRFVDNHYEAYTIQHNIPDKNKAKTESIGAAILLDQIPQDDAPTHIMHRIEQFEMLFENYLKQYSPKLTGMKWANKGKLGYGAHLIRNLRNYVAHGVFPIAPNPDYDWGNSYGRDHLGLLLMHACRLAALYIQALLAKYNTGFHSDSYWYCASMVEEGEGEGEEFNYFISHCKPEYIKTLHLEQDFSLTHALDYSA